MQRVAEIFAEAHSHGLHVIVKAIEAPQQLDVMRILHCDPVQEELLAALSAAGPIVPKLSSFTFYESHSQIAARWRS